MIVRTLINYLSWEFRRLLDVMQKPGFIRKQNAFPIVFIAMLMISSKLKSCNTIKFEKLLICCKSATGEVFFSKSSPNCSLAYIGIPKVVKF